MNLGRTVAFTIALILAPAGILPPSASAAEPAAAASAEGPADARVASPATARPEPLPWPDRPLTLADCLNLAEAQNGTIAAARKDLEAAEGVVIQTRAIVLPRLSAAGEITLVDEASIEVAETPFGSFEFGQTEIWDVGIRLVQSIYEGGRLGAAVRSARFLRTAAAEEFQAVLFDVFLEVRIAYFDALLARQQIEVQEASVRLLERELQDNQRRFNAGSVPRFNVLRAEVELANAQPRLIRARNDWRNARTRLASLLGSQAPLFMAGDVPLDLADPLEAPSFSIELERALLLAQEQRPELRALRAAENLRREDIVSARAGRRPSLQAFAGYGARRSQFGETFGSEVHGWNAGLRAQWDLFDGGLTRGRVVEAVARKEQAEIHSANAARDISVEVRVAHSNFTEARETLASQEKVVEQATEALRLANARAEAGSGTQLDVLSAQTALTEARTTQNMARRDYLVALARLQRAIGGFPAPR